MREERGKLIGDVTVDEPYTLWGSVAGTVTAIEGAKLYIRGAVYGDVVAKPGGRIHVFGNVSGDLTILPKSKVIHSGIVGGDVINLGGRLYIEVTAKVLGKIRTEHGETKIERPPNASEE